MSFPIENARREERTVLRSVMSGRSGLIARIVGSFHNYVATKYQKLRFGAAIETTFEVVRQEVDASIR